MNERTTESRAGWQPGSLRPLREVRQPEPQRAALASLEAELKQARAALLDLDARLGQVIQERDMAEEFGMVLAQAIGEHFRVDVGEHSSDNDPRVVALRILDGEYQTDSDAERALAALKAAQGKPVAWVDRRFSGLLGWHTSLVPPDGTQLYMAADQGFNETKVRELIASGAALAVVAHRSGSYKGAGWVAEAVLQSLKEGDRADEAVAGAPQATPTGEQS